MLLYNFGIRFIQFVIWTASLFQRKARTFRLGRKDIFKRLDEKLHGRKSPLVWVHCSSLGEFEQARPVIESLKREFPNHILLLSFFSPSGYEVRKKYPGADIIEYLPLDTRYNAKRWVEVTKPALAIFIKYEFWLNYAQALKLAGVPLISVSSIFREDQIFFRGYGSVFRRILKNFDHFFVQDTGSLKLLNSIGIRNVTVSGDTRFDRVVSLTKSLEPVPFIDEFKAGDKVMVLGSTWPEDMEVLVPFVNETGIKFIVAPHEIDEGALAAMEIAIEQKTIRYSDAGIKGGLHEYKVLLIDNVGMLSKLYRYGEFAFVGGGFGKGLHNILEPACYGIPIFFGNKNFEKFREARELIMRGGAFDVSGFSDFRKKYELVTIPENFLLACEVTRSYVTENLGATTKVMNYCRDLLAR